MSKGSLKRMERQRRRPDKPAPEVLAYVYEPPNDEQLANFAAAIVGVPIATAASMFEFKPEMAAEWREFHKLVSNHAQRIGG